MIRQNVFQNKIADFSDAERLLLVAALHSVPEKARAAFAAWECSVNFEALDFDSYFLLPALAANLGEQLDDSPLAPRITGISRKIWLENQIRWQFLSRTLKDLRDADIEFIQLNFLPRQRFALFLLDDISLLLKPGKLAAATQILATNGWLQTSAEANVIGFKNDCFGSLSLCAVQRDEDFAAQTSNSQEIARNTINIKTPLAENQFLRFAVNTPTSKTTLMRICLCAVLLLRENPALNWRKILNDARTQLLSARLLSLVEFLAAEFGTSVSPDVLAALKINAAKEQKAVRTLWRQSLTAYRFLRHIHNSAQRENPNSPENFMQFLRRRWQLGSIFFLPLEAIKRWRRLGQAEERR